MKWIDSETGLPLEQAERIKGILKKLEEENEQLKTQLSFLLEENATLRRRLSEIESGALGIRKLNDEYGERIELMPSDRFMAQLTSDGILSSMEPNILKIGDQDAYLNDIITANITVASSVENKEIMENVDELFARIRLPKPKKYKRKVGKGGEEIGFIAEEMPKILRSGNGYDLKALIAYLAWKLLEVENSLQKR